MTEGQASGTEPEDSQQPGPGTDGGLDGEGTTESAEPRPVGWGQRLRPWLAPAVVATLFIGGVGAGVTVWAELRDDGSRPSESRPPEVSTEVGSAADQQQDQTADTDTASGTDPGVDVGTCLSSADDLSSVVACDTAHAAEIIGTAGDCTLETATGYMGGTSEVDVLHRGVTVDVIDEFCVLSSQDQTVAVSFSNALQLDDGVALRECLNGRTGEFVACSDDHTGEVVARVDIDSTEPLDCPARATAYMGRSSSSLYAQLTVEEDQTESVRRCVVSVRADNRWLDVSLRELGSSRPDTRPF